MKIAKLILPVFQVFLLVALVALWLPANAYAAVAKDIADDPVVETRMMHLAEKVRCLVCQSEPVSTSHSDWSQDVRRIMRDKMKEGATDQEIMDLLVARFGKSVLYDTPVDKETMPLWSAPFLLLLIGGVFLVIQLKKRKELVVEAKLTAQDEQRAAALLDEIPALSVLNPSNDNKLSASSLSSASLPQGESADVSLRDARTKETQA